MDFAGKNIELIFIYKLLLRCFLNMSLVNELYLNEPIIFISRADFSKEPAFSWLSSLSEDVKMAVKKSKILFCNGYGFDELSPKLINSAIEYAVEVGTSIFFDPGPRGKSLCNGTPEEQRALGQFLRMSDVLLLTSDEV